MIKILFICHGNICRSPMAQYYFQNLIDEKHLSHLFYVDSAAELTAKAGGAAEVLAEKPYYRHIPRRGLKPSTRVSMWVSDRLRMVKMVRLGLGERRETFTGR